tara:strand:- start:258 stop:851 length:594 start_codon:yes stop_codon:yes gene_type:complete
MSVLTDLIGNSQDSFKTHAQRGGRGLSTTFSTLNAQANAGMGKYPAVGLHYDGCDKQSGGGYGFDQQSVADNAAFKGSYPSFSKYTKSNQCAGYKSKKRRRKRKRKRKSRGKSKRRSRRKYRKRKKSRNKKSRRKSRKRYKNKKRRKSKRRRQRGGATVGYSSPHNLNSSTPWATAPLSHNRVQPNCYDNYNHYKGL